MHQFFPYELRLQDGTVVGNEFIFHITQRVGFLDKTVSGYIPHKRDDGVIYYTKPFVYTGPAMQDILAINRKAIAGHHLWLDQDEGLCFLLSPLIGNVYRGRYCQQDWAFFLCLLCDRFSSRQAIGIVTPAFSLAPP